MKNVEDIYPLSPIQEGMLFHTLKEPGSGVYIEQYRCLLKGDLNPTLFREAWESIVERHSVLRTAFLWDGLDKPLQVVRQKVVLDWIDHDFEKLSESEYSQWLKTYLTDDLSKGFELDKAPLMRFRLIRVGDHTFQWLWSFHHLLSDGWSTAIILKDVFGQYRHLQKGEPQNDQPPSTPYREFIAWLKKQDLARAEAYWKEKLKDFTTPTSLPLRHSQSSKSGYRQIDIPFSRQLSNELKTLTQKYRLTLNTFIQGAWAVLLHRYTSENDIVFGSTVSGRPPTLAGVEEMVGLFINTLPVRAKIKPNVPLIQWLAELQKSEIEAQNYGYSPLVKIHAWSGLPPGLQLFDSIVVFENYPIKEDADNLISGLEISDIHYQAHSNFPLALIVVPGDHLRIIFVYDRSCYNEQRISRLFEHLRTLMRSFVREPSQSIGDLSILSDSDSQMLAKWRGGPKVETPFRTVHFLFEYQASIQSKKKAVAYNQRQINYGDLNRRANQLAHYLRHHIEASGKTIGIFMNRSIEMITGILGIIKTGAAYVPLDPTYPKDRLAHMIADSKLSFVLSLPETASALPPSPAKIIYLDDAIHLDQQFSQSNIDGAINQEDLAYIIYTSGSTGLPKGVMINHGNLAQSTGARLRYYKEIPKNFLLLSSISFDSSVAGIFGTLCQGGCLHIPDQEKYRDVDYLTALIEEKRITHMLCIPSLYQYMLQSYASRLDSLENVIVAGESCPADLVVRHFSELPKTQLFNEYGPTEATVWSTVFECHQDHIAKTVPIGRPIDNTHAYILDNKLRPVPPGFPGELYIGGPGISQGYVDQPDLTAEKFISYSFNKNQKDRVYKTGDWACFLDDGNIEYLGRHDEQIKMRGYRIELGEIETVLKNHPGVSESVVVVKKNKLNIKYLVAYVVVQQEKPGLITELRSSLQNRLPDYMIPAHIVNINRMPLLANGKVNRDALPEPNIEGSATGGDYVPARNKLEKELSAIWAKHLEVEKVGVTDNFFELGGDSFMALRLISNIKNDTGLDCSLSVLFRNPTIEKLVKYETQQYDKIKNSSLIPIRPSGEKIPIFLLFGTNKIHSFLDDDQPLYMFLTLFSDIPLPYKIDSIEKIAENYIIDIKKIFPKGPYILCGYSVGGIVAIEMAHQLRTKYNETFFLFLIEPTPLPVVVLKDPLKKSRYLRIRQRVRETPFQAVKLVVLKLGQKLKKSRVWKETGMIKDFTLYRLSKIIGFSFPRPWRVRHAHRLYGKAIIRYGIRPYSGPVTICQTEAQYNRMDWAKIFKGSLETHVIKEAQTHTDLIRDMKIAKIWVKYLNDLAIKVHKVN